MVLMPEARAGWNKVYLLFLNKFSGFTCGFFPLSPTEDVNSLFFQQLVAIQLSPQWMA